MILNKWMNRRTVAWRNGCFGNMDDHPVHTTPNHHPPKMDVLPKTFLQIILAAKWLVHGIQVHPPNSSDDLCLLFCFFFYASPKPSPTNGILSPQLGQLCSELTSEIPHFRFQHFDPQSKILGGVDISLSLS